MPTPIRLSVPELRIERQEAVVASTLSGIRPGGEIRFRFPAGNAPDERAMADAMFPIGLLIAMCTGRRLELNFPVSEQLVRAGRTVMEIYGSWLPKRITHVPIDVPVRRDEHLLQAGPVRGISAFTGGVDSFATALRNRENLNSVFYVWGYDLPLNPEFRELRANVQSNLRQAADKMQKRIIFVTTNLRNFINPHANWAVMSHGPAIAAVAHLLSASHNTMYIPSSYTYNDLQPWGSHPLTDPLWSSGRMQVIHDGAHLSRVDKTMQIASEPAVHHHLRVCLSKRTDYNCGTCNKCVRTMLGLELAGELQSSQVFPTALDLDAIKAMELTGHGQVIFMDQIIDHARRIGRDDIADVVSIPRDKYNAQH